MRFGPRVQMQFGPGLKCNLVPNLGEIWFLARVRFGPRSKCIFFSFQAHTHAHLKAHPTHTSHTNTYSLHTHTQMHTHRPMRILLFCICFQIDPSFLLLIVLAFSKFCCFKAYIPCGRWRATGNRLHMPVSVISYTYTHSHTYY